MKTNTLKATKTLAEAAKKATNGKELSEQELTAKLTAINDTKLKDCSEKLKVFMEANSFEIVPVVQLAVGQQVATFEVSKLINGNAGYVLRLK